MSYWGPHERAGFIRDLQCPAGPPPWIASKRWIGQLADDGKCLLAGSHTIAQLDAFFILRKAIAKQEIEEIVRHGQFSLLHF
jgi:hypothetical protein